MASLELKLHKVENTLSCITLIPVLGVVGGAAKVGLGLIQTVSALAITVIAGVTTLFGSETGKACCFRASKHILHGLGNICAGVIESIPFVGLASGCIRYWLHPHGPDAGHYMSYGNLHKPPSFSEINPKALLRNVPNTCTHFFSDINSSRLLASNGLNERTDFLNKPDYQSLPPIISKSSFVPKEMVEHLMRKKKNSALNVKYRKNDAITNMEGAMHTFVTPVIKVHMTADYNHLKDIKAVPLHAHRVGVMSTAIQPDFECSGNSEVIMRLVEATPNALKGAPLPDDFVILANKYPPKSNEFSNELPQYENTLLRHMVYHLTKDHCLPNVSEVKAMTSKQAKSELESIIKDPQIRDVSASLQGKFVNLKGHVISLEALYNIYLNQIVNEFSILESTLPQGYVYTIDPPVIFSKQIGNENVDILNRLQLLAIKEVYETNALKNLKIVGFNHFEDSTAINLYRRALPTIQVCSKQELFSGPNKTYSNTDGFALIEHNNSDGFGQNIETESLTSKDGVLGTFSDAAHALKRDRADLTSHIF